MSPITAKEERQLLTGITIVIFLLAALLWALIELFEVCQP